MSENKDTKQTRQRTKRFTVSGKYSNARSYGKDEIDIEEGDTCAVRVGAPYRDGDLVLIRCSRKCCGPYSDTFKEPRYHAQYFGLMQSAKKYKFTLKEWAHRGGRRHMDGEESIIIGPVVEVVKQGQKKGKSKKEGTRQQYGASFDWSYFGVHRGDKLVVEENGQTHVGALALILDTDADDPEESYFWHVCCVTEQSVRVCGSKDIEAQDFPLNLVIGSVVEIKHDNCTATKIKALRARLQELQDDDDNTLNVTRCYQVEKEIFDLEHPLETEEETGESDEILEADEISFE